MADESVETVSEYNEDDLITPREALMSIVHYVGTEYQAKQVIADGLHSGRVTATADCVWEDHTSDVREEWVPCKTEGFEYWEDIELWDDFFRESAVWPNDVVYWRWDDAEFVVFITDPQMDSEAVRLYVKGVRLVRKDVLALVGRNDRKGVGGKKPDRERWADFWVSILYNATSKDFDWTKFDNPHQLKVQLLEWTDAWSDVAFSESYLDSTVDVIWKLLVKRCAADRKNR